MQKHHQKPNKPKGEKLTPFTVDRDNKWQNNNVYYYYVYKKAAIGTIEAGPLAELVDGSFSVHYIHKDKKNNVFFRTYTGKIANFVVF